MAEKVALVELQRRFAKDKDKVELNKLLAELDGYITAAKKELDSGLRPQEYAAMKKYHAALEAAREAAPFVWAGSVNI